MFRQLSRLRVFPSIANLNARFSSQSGEPVNPNTIPCIDREPDIELPLPTYKYKENESFETQKARLVYQSRKRGMLENDLLLSTFAAKYLPQMNEAQVEQYDKLINGVSNDWDIYYWATKTKPTPDSYNNEVMNMLKAHVQNENREIRYRQPDL